MAPRPEGATPVDWTGYLRQQRRWARSVLDFKLRVYPRYARRMPPLERGLVYLHGLYYLRGPLAVLHAALLIAMLLTGMVPPGSGLWVFRDLGILWGTMLACELFRQRFFVDFAREWGVHWRAAFVAYTKWPAFVLAFAEALRGSYAAEMTTSKHRSSPRAYAFATVHALVAIALGGALAVALARGHAAFFPVQVGACLVVATSGAAVWTVFLHFPSPWDAAVWRRAAGRLADAMRRWPSPPSPARPVDLARGA